jgi:hypothetical protein
MTSLTWTKLAWIATATSLVCLGGVSQASAADGVWEVRPVYAPAHFAPGGSGELIVTVTNLGDAPISASEADPMKIGAQLPVGMSATSIENDEFFDNLISHQELPALTCELATLMCESASGTIYPYETIQVVIHVTVTKEPPAGSRAKLLVSGGGVSGASSEEVVPVGSAPVRFGIERFEQVPFNEDGSIDTQAGSHPFQFTTTETFNQGYENTGEQPAPTAMPKNLTFDLPPGVVSNPAAVPQCPLEKFDPNAEGLSECPPDTMVGVSSVALSFQGDSIFTVPQTANEMTAVYNLAPSVGEPARFGFLVFGIGSNVPVYLDTSVRTGGGYNVVVHVNNISEELWFVGNQLSLWGTPGDPSHNSVRGQCLYEFIGKECESKVGETSAGAPLLTLPTSCTGLSNPLTAGLEANTWEEPGVLSHAQYALHDSSGAPVGMDGCDRLAFEPEIRVAPDGEAASSPSGLTVDVHVPQKESLVPSGLAEADVKDIAVALPEGVAVNPAAGDGLQGCSEGLAGYLPGESAPPGDLRFTPTLSAPFCPNASKIGEVTIHTPLLSNPLKGFVYLASQNENPFGSLVAMYIVAEDPVSGVVVKLAGEVRLSETGQIVTYIRNNPQLPFEDAELHFFGGERAPLATPAHCGAYETTASFVPWSGIQAVPSSSTFDITSGPNGTPCPGASLPFSPSLTGGTINNNGGAFSPLSTTIGREDGQQNMSGVMLHMPPGLSGLLSGVELCPEAQANAGSCGTGSLIGETTVSAGVGSDPVSVTGGKVYITGPYHGAPFGLSIVNPVKAGPLDLEHDTSNPAQDPACDCVVVRGKIEVNPSTAALTVTTNNEDEGYAIPHLIDGIPVQIKKVNVLINRPGFTFNPTSCDPMKITGSIQSDEGASSPVEVPFQVANCALLKFAPKFSVSTSGRTSKADGASLTAKVSEPSAPFGSQANIARVKVDLPKQLPSRLTTLQKACTAAQFESNPAGCPSASFIGHAVVHTPLIPVALEGPAIFVSHGGEAFPSLIMVLQGYGVTVDLVGTTFISKAGITSSTFKTVPDVPFSAFELSLPEGPYSALTANGDLCTSKLAMPTEFLAQNGAKINESTPVSVSGCAKTKALTRAQKLARALRACRKKPKGAERTSCQRMARKKYGAVKTKKKR